MSLRCAFYGRLSTDDKQDQTLARPSQLEACRRKASELGGEIVVEFFDQESGAKDDRPGWTSLTQEARDAASRRFDAVVIYQTSRLSRDRVSAGLFHRELRKVGVQIHYAIGAGDPSTAEGGLLIALQQAFDEYERAKLSRETKRGMRENARQGFRVGGRAPYGYRLHRTPHPVPARAKAGETKSRLVPDPDQAPVIVEIFHLWADKGWACKAIADHLNRVGGPPSPRHVDTTRNIRGDWAKSTIRAILKNPTYTGRLHWNRLDFATQREAGGTARLRDQAEWVVAEVEHEALISDELFALAELRFAERSRRTNGRRNGHAPYLLSGMVRCSSGHQPLAMSGRTRKDHVYMACDYGRSYGKEAADAIPGHGQWLYLREDVLLPLIEDFFAERIFGPMRLDKLEHQLRAHARATRRHDDHRQRDLTKQIADIDTRISRLIDALEGGLDADEVRRRLRGLQEDKENAEAELRALAPASADSETPDARALLDRIPDLSHALRAASPAVKRQLFDAFGLQITYDRARNQINIRATISEALAGVFEECSEIPKTLPAVATSRARVPISFQARTPRQRLQSRRD